MTEEDVHQACIELIAEKEAEQPDEGETMPLEPAFEEQPPADEEMMEDIGKILATGSSTKPVSTAPFCNPSPPPKLATDAIEVDPPPPQLPSQGMRMSLYPQEIGLAPSRPRSPPDNHKTAVKHVSDWLYSTATPTGEQPPPKTAAAKSSSREGHGAAHSPATSARQQRPVAQRR
ncbi:hypothetical protein AAVH_14874 [Aphelenchoides avenae]|nr:hypothetical protein AAVH_14874 [Aphelenchus avenae]